MYSKTIKEKRTEYCYISFKYANLHNMPTIFLYEIHSKLGSIRSIIPVLQYTCLSIKILLFFFCFSCSKSLSNNLTFHFISLNFVLLNKFSLLVVKIPTRIDVKYDVTISSCDTFLRFSFSFSVIYLLVDHGCSGAL